MNPGLRGGPTSDKKNQGEQKQGNVVFCLAGEESLASEAEQGIRRTRIGGVRRHEDRCLQPAKFRVPASGTWMLGTKDGMRWQCVGVGVGEQPALSGHDPPVSRWGPLQKGPRWPPVRGPCRCCTRGGKSPRPPLTKITPKPLHNPGSSIPPRLIDISTERILARVRDPAFHGGPASPFSGRAGGIDVGFKAMALAVDRRVFL